jgi:redox-sensitive bicupin YhaK (pirin superfamily)
MMTALVRVVPLSQLAFSTEGATRGYAHIGFDDHPPEAPGYLDFKPLSLFAAGRMEPGEGLSMHPHARIENLMMVLSGRLQHRATVGDPCTLGPDDICNLSTGSGVAHAESCLGDEPARVLVIWLTSNDPNGAPTFQRTTISRERRHDRLTLLASGRVNRPEGVLSIRCDAALFGAHLSEGTTVSYDLAPARRAYLTAVDGPIQVNGQRADANERVLVEKGGALRVTAQESTEIVLVDLP